jgi:hypothetical protein
MNIHQLKENEHLEIRFKHIVGVLSSQKDYQFEYTKANLQLSYSQLIEIDCKIEEVLLRGVVKKCNQCITIQNPHIFLHDVKEITHVEYLERYYFFDLIKSSKDIVFELSENGLRMVGKSASTEPFPLNYIVIHKKVPTSLHILDEQKVS